MGNHLGPLPEASDGPEGQEPPVRAVGGQGELREFRTPPRVYLSSLFHLSTKTWELEGKSRDF